MDCLNKTAELLIMVQKNKVAGESPTILSTQSKNISASKEFTEDLAKSKN